MNKNSSYAVLTITDPNGTISPTLFWDEEHVVIIDACFPLQIDILEQELGKVGFSASRITDIIFTHQDVDHIGEAKEILKRAPKAKTYAHKIEKPYIQGDLTPVKLAALEALDNPSPMDIQRINMLRTAHRNRVVHVDHELSDGDLLPFCGGLEIIHSPGHTPGHICVLHRLSGTLAAGDALNVLEGRLSGPNLVYSLDYALALESVKKLSDYNISRIVAYHGGLFELSQVKEELLETIK